MSDQLAGSIASQDAPTSLDSQLMNSDSVSVHGVQPTPPGQVQTPSVVEATVSAMAQSLGVQEVKRVNSQLVVVLHLTEPMHFGTLKPLQRFIFERNGARMASNLYRPFHRHDKKKEGSPPTGIARNVVPQLFKLLSTWNGLSLAIPNVSIKGVSESLENASQQLNQGAQRLFTIKPNESFPNAEGENITRSEIANVRTWVAPLSGREGSDPDVANLFLSLHLNAGNLYDTEKPEEVLNQIDTFLAKSSEENGNVPYLLVVTMSAAVLPYGIAAQLAAELAVDPNVQPMGWGELVAQAWTPADADIRSRLLIGGDFAFVKAAGHKYGEVPEEGEAEEAGTDDVQDIGE